MEDKIKLIIISISFITLSCTHNIELDIERPGPCAVLNASLSKDSVVIANISRSLNGVVLHSTNPEEINGLFIEDASIELFANNISKGIMQKDSQPGRYSMPGYFPLIGDNIRMEVITNEYEPLSAEVKLPSEPEIIAIDTLMIFQNESELYPNSIKVNIRFRNKQEQNYYMLSISAYEISMEGDTIMLEYPITITHEEELVLEEMQTDYYHSYMDPKTYIFPNDIFRNRPEYTLKMSLHNLPFAVINNDLSNSILCRIELSEISQSLYLYNRSKRLQFKQLEDIFGSIGLREPIPTYTNVHNGYGLLSAKQTTVREVRIISIEAPSVYSHSH